MLEETAPSIRDAAEKSFAVQADDLRRVAAPELLDDIASNALTLRLGNRAFASELYADIRDQAIRAPERWRDVDLSIRLSSMDESAARGSAPAGPDEM